MKQLSKVLTFTLVFGTCIISYASIPEVSGEIITRINKNEAVVNLGKDKIQVGDRIAVVQRVCESKPRLKGTLPECKDNQLGQGEVISVHRKSSIVRFADDVNFEEGDILVK
ncbi:MAG: hypothetical protein SGJ18_00765 [Pseudomonadota bacterium]|nr:hypothetical protein [Pseudomonadota bacterium]